MPLWYPSDSKKEHLRVITGVGIFDTSHMAAVLIRGGDAFSLLQKCFSRDLKRCFPMGNKPSDAGKCVYGVYLNEKGGVIDDALVYRLNSDNYMTVVNAGMGPRVAGHLRENMEGNEVAVTDMTDRVGKIDVQGPMSAKVLRKVLLEPDRVLRKMPYFSFKGHFHEDASLSDSETVRLKDGTPILISRTGYTGEFGYEIFVDPDGVLNLWESILEEGREFGLLPCGLAARDTLRVGALLPLSHQDIGQWPFIHNPWTFALPFNSDGTDFTKAFIGANALKNIDVPEYTHAFLGFDPRKISINDPASVLNSEGNEIGRVLSCVSEPSVGWHGGRVYSIFSPDRPADFNTRGLCCGFVKVTSILESGHRVKLRDRRREIDAVIVDDIRPHRTARHSVGGML